MEVVAADAIQVDRGAGRLCIALDEFRDDLDVEIIVSESTYDTVRSMFKWKPTGSVQVRGRSEPVRTYSVEGLSDTNRPPSLPA